MFYNKFLIIISIFLFLRGNTTLCRGLFQRKTATTFLSNLVERYNPFRSLHWSNLKGTSSIFTSERQHLSPLSGAALAESNWLENLYEFGPKSDGTAQLTRELFNKLENEFRPTHNKSLPGASLTPEIVALIVSALEKNTFDDPKTRQEIIKAWLEAHAAVLKTRVTKAKVERVLDAISNAARECQVNDRDALYMPHTVKSILLAQLYKKADTKKDIQAYVSGVQEKLSDAVNESYNAQEFTEDKYSVLDFKEEAELATEPLEEVLDKKFEKIIVDKIQAKYALPFVEQKCYSFGQKPPTPNCMEAALQNIFNKLLYNSSTHSFDFSLLPSKINPSMALQEFYASHTVDQVNEGRVGQVWMNLLSGKDFLRYKKGDYDLNPRVSNFIKVFQYLFDMPINDDMTLEELSALFSDDRRRVIFKKQSDSDNDNEIKIEIQYPRKRIRDECVLHLQPNHAWLKMPEKESKRTILIDDAIRTAFDNDKHRDALHEHKISTLLPLVYTNMHSLISEKRLAELKNIASNKMTHAYFASNVRSSLDIRNNLLALAAHGNYNAYFKDLIMKLRNKLSKNYMGYDKELIALLRASKNVYQLVDPDFPEAIMVAIEQWKDTDHIDSAQIDEWLRALNNYPVMQGVALNTLCAHDLIKDATIKNHLIEWALNKNFLRQIFLGTFDLFFYTDLIVALSNIDAQAESIILEKRPMHFFKKIAPKLFENPVVTIKLLSIHFPEAIYAFLYQYFDKAQSYDSILVAFPNLNEIDIKLNELNEYPHLKRDILLWAFSNYLSQEECALCMRHACNMLLPRKKAARPLTDEECQMLYERYIVPALGQHVPRKDPLTEKLIDFYVFMERGFNFIYQLSCRHNTILKEIPFFISLETDFQACDEYGNTFTGYLNGRYYSKKQRQAIERLIQENGNTIFKRTLNSFNSLKSYINDLYT